MIIGNTKKRELLYRIIDNKNIPHALLFSGPEMIGKKMIAFDLINKIFGNSNYNPDVSIVSPIEGNIEIDEIRKAKQKLSLKSYYGKLKVLIIDDSHLMRKDAQNAFLKMLEEPKGDTLIIFITSYPQMILKTIRSRMQEVKFSLVAKSEIEEHLISLGALSEKASEIALISSGQIGKAINFFENQEKIDLFNNSIDDIVSLSNSKMKKRFEYAEKFKDDKGKINAIIDIWERFLRREMLIKIIK
ncbi:MAG: AAA family ATPase [Candidatus Paceibacterota bacterium]|jgi:DNA polymerase-3 subunit delta'